MSELMLNESQIKRAKRIKEEIADLQKAQNDLVRQERDLWHELAQIQYECDHERAQQLEPATISIGPRQYIFHCPDCQSRYQK